MSSWKTSAPSGKEQAAKKSKKWPVAAKALLLKAWFAGAVYFFVGWGLFLSSLDQLDLTLALGLVLGAVTDLMVNRILIYMDNGGDAYQTHMMFYSKKFYFFWVNILYGVLLSFLIAYTYHAVNLIAVRLGDLPGNTIVLGAEPILYGVMFAAYDALLVTLKNLIKARINKKRSQA